MFSLRSSYLRNLQHYRFSTDDKKPLNIKVTPPISNQKLKEILQKHEQEQQKAKKFIAATEKIANNTSTSTNDKPETQSRSFNIKAQVNEFGELDIDIEQYNTEIFKAYQRNEKEKREKELEQQDVNRIQKSQKMAEQLNFDDLTNALSGYKAVGSARVGAEQKKPKKSQYAPTGKPRGRPKVKKDGDLEENQHSVQEEIVATNEHLDDLSQMENQSNVKRPRGRPKVKDGKEEQKKRGRPASGSKEENKSSIRAEPKKNKEENEDDSLHWPEENEDRSYMKNNKTYEGMDKSKLNEADLEDLKEIRELEKIAHVREKEGILTLEKEQEELLKEKEYLLDIELKALKRQQYLEKARNEISLDYDEEGKPLTVTQTDFLQVISLPATNSIKVLLTLPQYEVKNDAPLNFYNYEIIIPFEEMKLMHQYFQDYEDIIAYTDGSSLSNPGRSGSGVAFMGKPRGDQIRDLIAEEIGGIGDQLKHRQGFNERTFLFGFSMHLGEASNNYAEYVGIIMAQLIFAMFKQVDIQILTDSMIISNQIKGVIRCLNVRLVELLKIVHSLAFKFHSMGLNYIPRDENTIADKLSREGSQNMVSITGQPYQFHFNLQKLIKHFKSK